MDPERATKPAPYPLKNVATYIRLSGALRAIPFTWIVHPSGSSSRIHLLENHRSSLLLWRIVTFTTFAFFGFLLLDFYFQYPKYMERKDILYGYLHLFWITGFLVLSAVRLHFWRRYPEIVRGLNQMVGLVHYLEEKHSTIRGGGAFTKTWRLLDRFMILSIVCSIGCCVPYGLLVIPFQRHRALFYALLPPELQCNPFILYLLAPLWNMFFISFQVAGYFVESLLNIVFIESIRRSLAILETDGWTHMSPKELIQTHQMLRLLARAYHVSFGDLGLPAFKLTISTLIIFSTVAALKFMGQVNFILTTFSLFVSGVTAVAISILLLMAGKIATKSSNIVRRLGAGAGGLRARRRLEGSSRPIVIEVGVYYGVDRMTPLTYFTLLFSYLITILISFQLRQ